MKPPETETIDSAAEIASLNSYLDCLSESQLKRYAENYRLVLLIEKGASVNESLKELNINRPRRTVQDMVARYRQFGESGLLDKRWRAKKPTKVLIKEVTDIALAWYFERSAAGYRGIAELTAESCRKKNLPVPSESAVKQYLCALPEGIKAARKGKLGLRNWQRNIASVVQQQKTTFANELWQGDHTPPEIWIKQKVQGIWEPAKVHLSAFLDDFSRAIPGFTISTKYSDAWSISILSYYAMMPKKDPNYLICGLPFGIENDCGADWISEAVQTGWQSLGIVPYIDHPYYPNSKGKVERWFRTLDTSCLRKLPGHFDSIGRTHGAAKQHVHKLLTLEQLREQITNWIVNVYHQSIHRTTNRKPIEMWEENVHFRSVDENDLRIFLLKFDKERTIRNDGLEMTIDDEKHQYFSRAFEGMQKRRVLIRYNPEQMETIWVYCAATREFLCQAFDKKSVPYTDIKDARNAEKQFLKGFQAKTAEYFENVLANDRLVEQEKEWKIAKQKIKKMPKPEKVEDNTGDAAVKDLINRFRQNDRSR